MRVEKEKLNVCIICVDGSLLHGFVHLNPGERLIDFLNDQKEDFIAVTNAVLHNLKEVHSFKLVNEMSKKKSAVILNKAAIQLMEEI